MANYLLLLEYDGTRFSGWQKQPGCRTVQSEIETAAGKVLGCAAAVTAAGRTDKGVHATAQAANLRIAMRADPVRLRTALNAVLPADVAVTSVRRVPEEFNARFCARRKTYRYHIWNMPFRSVWLQGRSWHIIKKLDIAAMRRAARCFLGTRDFSAFDASGSSQENKTVAMRAARIARRGGSVTLLFEADRFLYKMVRTMVGTLVEVGRGKRTPEQVRRTVESHRRSLAGPTAPACGLFLEKVVFGRSRRRRDRCAAQGAGNRSQGVRTTV